ncbi:MAG: hypothetical protein CM15mP77_2570 [Synechococcus sp.]|nr:MAG: hypothetical protein CM15mP77_2570 [Synechococcus sp.]
MGTVMVLAGRVKARARRAGGVRSVGHGPHTPHISPHLFAHPEVLSFLVNLALCQQ